MSSYFSRENEPITALLSFPYCFSFDPPISLFLSSLHMAVLRHLSSIPANARKTRSRLVLSAIASPHDYRSWVPSSRFTTYFAAAAASWSDARGGPICICETRHLGCVAVQIRYEEESRRLSIRTRLYPSSPGSNSQPARVPIKHLLETDETSKLW